MTPRDLTVAMEDAITGIYRLQEATDSRVSTSELAAELDVESATISSMFTKLADSELIDREKHRPVMLTDAGEMVALRVLRNHRLVESLLVELFDYGWDEVHEPADRLEHHLSERLAQSIADVLDSPTADPHGDPIPDAELDLPTSTDVVSLSVMNAGECAEIMRIRLHDDEQFEYLAAIGIRPNVKLEVVERTPFGMLTVRTDDHEQSLPEAVAARILVVPAETPERESIYDSGSRRFP